MPSFSSQKTGAELNLDGGAEGIRTPDPHNAIVVLYQLSYDPIQSQKATNDSMLCQRLLWAVAQPREDCGVSFPLRKLRTGIRPLLGAAPGLV